ncbi:hypothetical protein DFH28DRAFT_953406 [Melampsora americana]|nr:hypothetical protein DFH28DRAFT_953406 [Melampsora americana]
MCVWRCFFFNSFPYYGGLIINDNFTQNSICHLLQKFICFPQLFCRSEMVSSQYSLHPFHSFPLNLTSGNKKMTTSESIKLKSNKNLDIQKAFTGFTMYCGWYLYMIIVFNLITSHIQPVDSLFGTENSLQKEVELEEYLPNRHDSCTLLQRVQSLDSEHLGGPHSGDILSIDGDSVLEKTFGFPIMALDERSPPFNSPRPKIRNCISHCYDFLSGKDEEQETQKALAQPLLSGEELCFSSSQDSLHLKKSKIMVPHSLYRSDDGEFPDSWKRFGKALETYIHGNGKERERETLLILHYTRRLSFDSFQIDAILHIFDQLLKRGELSLFEKAHLSFSLHSFGRFYCAGITKENKSKIYQLAQLLEQHCHSDPKSLVAVWNGSDSEDDQVVRDLLDPMLSLTQANFDNVVKSAAWRSSWIRDLITSDGLHETRRALSEAEPMYIEIKLKRIRNILEGFTAWNQSPTTWDFLYLMKTLYILQKHVEQKMKHLKEHRPEGWSNQDQNEWDSVLSTLIECKDLIMKPDISIPPKNNEMRLAYSEILNSQVQEEGLNWYGWGEGSQNVFLRMARQEELIPEKGITQGLTILTEFMSRITKPKALIESIQGIGTDPSVITSIRKHGDHFYHNKILRLLQWLSMKYYVDDKVDVLIKKQIIKKAIEVHREIGNSESRDLVLALIGRLLSLHPTDQEILKLAKFDSFTTSLQIQNLSRDFTAQKSQFTMSPIKLAIKTWKFLYED